MKFDLLPGLLNTGITIVEIGLCCGGEHFNVKIFRFLVDFFRQADDVYLTTTTTCENTSNTS